MEQKQSELNGVTAAGIKLRPPHGAGLIPQWPDKAKFAPLH